MQLTVLDEDFNTIQPISVFRTLIWKRRYTKLGAFELHVSPDLLPLLKQGEYLYRNDAEELGVIKEVYYKQSDTGSLEAYAKGNFAERLLEDRVIEKTTILNGKTEEVMRSLVDLYAINPEDSDRKIEHLRLGKENDLGTKINSQITGGSLSEELYTLGNAENISHRVKYNYLTNDLEFEVWKGKDRRQSQTENSWATFSDAYDNVRGVTYKMNSDSYKNIAYVAGEEKEDGTRMIVEVDIRTSPEEKRRELYVDARDLQSKGEDEETMDEEEYKLALQQRGLEKLAEYKMVETAESDVDPSANLVYKKDFDLGDCCEYINQKIGIAIDQIITEIVETYEGGCVKIEITLGNEGASTVKQLIKREA